jgi:hypothetical protein
VIVAVFALALAARSPAMGSGPMMPMPQPGRCTGGFCSAAPQRTGPSHPVQPPMQPRDDCPEGTVPSHVRPHTEDCLPAHPLGDQVWNGPTTGG